MAAGIADLPFPHVGLARVPRSHYAPLLFAIGMLLISMVSDRYGAELAKQLFPLIGAQGATACRNWVLGTLILHLVQQLWR